MEYLSIDLPVILTVSLEDFVMGEWIVRSESTYLLKFSMKMILIHPD